MKHCRGLVLVAAATLLASCDSPDVEGPGLPAKVSLYQFEGERVILVVCNKILVNDTVSTPNDKYMTGFSLSKKFPNRGGCKINLIVDDSANETVDLLPTSRYILITNITNPAFVDRPIDCRRDCLKYSIEQYDEAPPFD